jgi:hypothetical protein
MKQVFFAAASGLQKARKKMGASCRHNQSRTLLPVTVVEGIVPVEVEVAVDVTIVVMVVGVAGA